MSENDSSPTLVNLPHDIIRMIIRVGEKSLESMQLISRSWNASVYAHLSDLGCKPALERVFLCPSAAASDARRSRSYLGVNTRRFATSRDICMWAVVPDWIGGARIGLGKWLTISKRFRKSIEVQCAPYKISTPAVAKREESSSNYLYQAALGVSLMAAIYSIGSRRYLLSFACTLLSIQAFKSLKPKQPKVLEDFRKVLEGPKLGRFTRFFSTFSHLETLVLYEFRELRTLDAALKTMGDIHVKRLEAHYLAVDEDVGTRKLIVDFVRQHRVKHVLLRDFFLTLDNLDIFVNDILETDSTLDIYAMGGGSALRRRSFWKEMTDKLDMERVSMQISFSNDASFDARLAKRSITTHLNFMTQLQRINGI